MKRAFTLIELLVVIAIIAILAAILFPVFAQAKAAAKKTADLSNEKQLGMSTQIYLSDSDDNLPIAYPDNNMASYTTPANRTATSDLGLARRQAFWTNSLYPYMKNYGIHAIVGAPEANWFSVTAADNPLHYVDGATYNSYLNAWNSTSTDSPADVVMFWPGNGNQNVVGVGNCYPLPYFKKDAFPTYAALGSTPYQFRNTGDNCVSNLGIWTGGDQYNYNIYTNGFNMAYVDGHSKFVVAGSSRSPWSKVDSAGHILSWNVDSTDTKSGCNYVAPMAPVRSSR